MAVSRWLASHSRTSEIAYFRCRPLDGVTHRAILPVDARPTESQTSSFSGRIDRNRTVSHTVTSGVGNMQLELDWSENRADLELRVRDSDATLVFVNPGNARPKTGSFPITVEGDYRFEIQNDSRRTTNYTLTVTHPVATPDGQEPPDATAPTVNISSPAAGSTVSGTVTVAASATDDRAVAYVEFYVDGAPIGSDSTSPYAVGWDTTTVADGTRV